MFLYMYFTWSEPRLDLPAKLNIPKNEYIPLDLRFLFDHLWMPDIFIYRLKDIKKVSFFENLGFGGLYLFGDSRISYDLIFEVTIYCFDMNFSFYIILHDETGNGYNITHYIPR